MSHSPTSLSWFWKQQMPCKTFKDAQMDSRPSLTY
jgi:hypothetical protein